MGRAVLLACLPWLLVLIVCFGVVYLLVRVNGSRIEPGRLRRLHRDEGGGVQSLSFVLTLPLLVMILLLIVQVSQLMIGTVVVHYAAYAAARAAIVWIPARVSEWERENCISWFEEDLLAADNRRPITDRESILYGSYGALEGGVTFAVEPGGAKFEKIRSAAVLACMPIAPSRDLGQGLSAEGQVTAEIIKALYRSMAPSSSGNAAIPRRIEEKLAYAIRATDVQIRFFHPNREPPLPKQYYINGDVEELPPNENEIGWQDPITVTVRHDLALLPGPGRLLARDTDRADRLGRIMPRIGGVYSYPLTASATMGNEGERSVIPYEYYLD